MCKIKDTIIGENPKNFYTKSVQNLSDALDKKTPLEITIERDNMIFNAVKNVNK